MNYDIRNIVKHTSIYSFGRLVSKAIGFLMIPLYTHYLSPQDYGVIEVLALMLVLSNIVIQGGVSAAIFKIYNGYDNETDKKHVISTMFVFLTAMGFIFLIVLSLFAERISILLTGAGGYGYYVNLMLISFFFSTAGSVPETFLLIQKRSALFTIISLGTLVIDLSMNIYMVAIARLGIVGILYSSIIGRVLNSACLVLITVPKVGLGLKIEQLRKILRFAYPLVPGELSLFVFAYSDRLFLSHLSGLKSVGLYSLGYKFAFMISFLMIQPFMQIWQQEMYEIKKRVDAPEIFGSIYTYLAGAILVVAAVMSIFIKDIVAIMASAEFLGAWKVVPIVAFAYVFRATALYFQMGMFFQNKTLYISYITMVGTGVVIILNYLLIPEYKEIGAALSTFGSYGVLAVVSFIVSQKLYRVNIEVTRLLKLFFIVGTILALYLFINIDSRVFSIGFRLTCIPVIVFAMYIVRFFNEEERGKIQKLAYGVFKT
jgi:O-antigen/teichoic acid export membrane protein